MTVLLTGAAGFIGFHTAKVLLEQGRHVIGIDNCNDYYDPALKHARLEQLKAYDQFEFHLLDISDYDALQKIVQPYKKDIEYVVHLAAQAGVRYSIENPFAYGRTNLMGHLAMLEIVRHLPNCKHFVYASSSSVYGGNETKPSSIEHSVNDPVSLYAATKGAKELMTQSYSHMYKIPATGLRFFTVYGPWGRPDMAPYIFTRLITEGKPITVFNHGKMKRDFTYIDDVVAGTVAALDKIPAPEGDYCIGNAAHRIFNLGNNRSEHLLEFIDILGQAIGKPVEKIMAPMEKGDIEETAADIKASQDILGFKPETPISEGVPRLVEWYNSYHNAS
jgi:UDP-glucuronate 4-epimerase